MEGHMNSPNGSSSGGRTFLSATRDQSDALNDGALNLNDSNNASKFESEFSVRVTDKNVYPPEADTANRTGVLFIGDPHLASRAPGFRKDDYPQKILGKLRFAIDYAREHSLLPVLLGDLFDFPRDNANWLLVALHALLDRETLAIYGNHDCKENTPGDNDTISVLRAARTLWFLSAE